LVLIAIVFSPKYNKIYAFTHTGIVVYAGEIKNIFKKVDSVMLQSSILGYQTLSISPDENKIAISTKYGFRLYQLQDGGLIEKDHFKEIYYPENRNVIYKFVWIDNATLVAGGYIIELKE